MKMEQTECSETSAYKLQTPGKFIILVHSTHIYLPMKMEHSVPKRRHINSRRRGITQEKAHDDPQTVSHFLGDKTQAGNQSKETALRAEEGRDEFLPRGGSRQIAVLHV